MRYTPDMESGLWLFGYGSLIWRPDFPFQCRHAGLLRGWARRFWQGSTDHRGVPEAPGRVVTLVPRLDAECCGVVFRLSAETADTVLTSVDHREKGGYERHEVRVELRDGRAIDAIVYVATPGNPNYLGPASVDVIARQVAGASGPSGDNVEYVLKLAEALREMRADDPHVFELARSVRQRLALDA